ncbi:MAG TPA: hypothetical protein VGD29_25600 [Actinoplanes sp.]
MEAGVVELLDRDDRQQQRGVELVDVQKRRAEFRAAVAGQELAGQQPVAADPPLFHQRVADDAVGDVDERGDPAVRDADVGRSQIHVQQAGRVLLAGLQPSGHPAFERAGQVAVAAGGLQPLPEPVPDEAGPRLKRPQTGHRRPDGPDGTAQRTRELIESVSHGRRQ